MASLTQTLVVGEAIADFLPEGDDAYRVALGGSGVNTARALGRLGLPVGYCWSLSSDRLGRRFVEMLARDGVDLTLAAIVDRPSALAIVEPSGASAGSMFALHLSGTAHELPPALGLVRPDDLLGTGTHLHACSFAATVGPVAGDVLALMRHAKANGSSSYDPNIRAACLPPRGETVALVESRVAAATIARASEEDLAWLYPALQPHEVLQRWRMLGASMAVVTRAAAGALALAPDKDGTESWIEVRAPVILARDTVGAGDTFTAGLLAAMSDEGALGRPNAGYGPDAVRRWLTFATRAASFTCTRAGCDPPTRGEIAAFV